MLWSRELTSGIIWHPDRFVKSQVSAYIQPVAGNTAEATAAANTEVSHEG